MPRWNKPELEPVKTPTTIDVAWSAGVYEGEGTCRISGNTKRGYSMAVTQKDPEILCRLRDWFGGSVRDNGSGTGIYIWEICGDRARIFAVFVYPFLSGRRKVQIDSTNGLDFLCGVSPVGLDQQQICTYLSRFQNTYTKDQQRKNPAPRRDAKTGRFGSSTFEKVQEIRASA